MRTTLLPFSATFILFISLLFLSCKSTDTSQAPAVTDSVNTNTANLEGAWKLSGNNGPETVMLVQDGFITIAVYDEAAKEFGGTYGGTYTLQNDQLNFTYEFNTFDKALVGKTVTANYKLANGSWQLSGADQRLSGKWEKVDERNSNSPLAGTWRITGRERDGEMQTIQPAARKTYKVLSSTRFQWIAFNSETGDFSGTGGGTYTAQNGKYTEHIEFFSRDSSRVGMQLSFDFRKENGKWHHSGMSSTGKPINEVWQRISVK